MLKISDTIEYVYTGRRRTWLVWLAWVAVAAATCFRLAVMLGHPIQPTGYPETDDVYFLDLRDTVWTPGRFLLAGGNPYDPDTYLAANPWSLPFALYAPVWLFLGLALGPLPFITAIVVYQVISLVVAIVMLRVLLRWTMPTIVDLAVPVVLLWMNIWYPGRGSLSVQMGSLLAVLGTTLVIRQLTDHRAAESRTDRSAALGVALTLIKAQFGLTIVLVCLAAKKVREVAWAVIGVGLLSIPVTVMCVTASGGFLEFIRSVLRDVNYANSPHAPTSLTFPGQRRLDLLGILARHGLDVAAPWLTIAVTAVAFSLAVLIVRMTRNPLLLSATISVSTLLGIYHSTYDLLLLLVPVAVGVGMILRGELTNAIERVVFGALLIVVLHLQTVTKTLIPGFYILGADTANVVLMAIALIAAVYRSLQLRWVPEPDREVSAT